MIDIKDLFKCEECGKVSENLEDIVQCESKHKLLSEQCHKVANEISKFYDMGGELEIYIGSADARELGEVIFSTEKRKLIFKTKREYIGGEVKQRVNQMGEGVDKLQFKSWTISSFNKVLRIFK